MHENTWSPFDPEWYQKAFDKFISTADQLFNQDQIIDMGFTIPDADGSKSSVFRNSAVLNNSFDEKALRETLKDIYLSSVSKLTASNHDNVQFYQYKTHMVSDKNDQFPVTLDKITGMASFIIPTDKFFASNRDKFKLKQFYRKWISIQDILNNQDIFGWSYLLFINQRPYSEYELRIDDHEVTIRFPYYEIWVEKNYPVYIYKFETNASCRMKIDQYHIKENNYMIPVENIPNQLILNSSHAIGVINRIGDINIRTDGNSHIDVMSDNIEFLTIHDGVLDLSNISIANRDLIMSESSEYLWLSLIVPKFMNEYPILLPTDVVFRPYIFDMSKVVTNINGEIKNVMTMQDAELHQVYSNGSGHINEKQDGWKYMIRPVVLSDAYKNDTYDPYIDICKQMSELKTLTIQAAELVAWLRTTDKSSSEYTSNFASKLNELKNTIDDIHSKYNAYLINKKMNIYEEYEEAYSYWDNTINDAIENQSTDRKYTNPSTGRTEDFWQVASPMIYLPRSIIDKYDVSSIITHISRQPNLWNDLSEYEDQLRFSHPIDSTDFWTFEYDIEKNVWRPYILDVERHFPDVYTLTDPNESTPTPNRVFKAFIFYSDTMNPSQKSINNINASPDWTVDMENYMYNRGGVYRDIFMEKFYWLGINTVYRGLLQTKFRWELIEYIIDNDSYNRFNNLFMKSMEPYFKLGLSTYLKSDNFEFPFDDAISKMQESINDKFIGYQKVTNYEIYLNKTWIPSYFDYIISIMEGFDYTNRIVYRPRTTFDTKRLLPMLINIQDIIIIALDNFDHNLSSIINDLGQDSFGLNLKDFESLRDNAYELKSIITNAYEYTKNLDIDIYSNDDINAIIAILNDYMKLLGTIETQCIDIAGDATKKAKWERKREYYDKINSIVLESLDNIIDAEVSITDDVDYFLHLAYDPESAGIVTIKDDSIIGQINQFNYPWSDNIKEIRNALYYDLINLYSNYDKSKSYARYEVTYFSNQLTLIILKLEELNNAITDYMMSASIIDNKLLDKIKFTLEYATHLQSQINQYGEFQDKLYDINLSMNKCINELVEIGISDTEIEYCNSITTVLKNLLNAYGTLFIEYDHGAISADIDNIKSTIITLFEFNDNEKAVFKLIENTVNIDTGFVSVIKPYNETIIQMQSYMDTVNIPYIPDKDLPTYATVYNVSEIEIINDGFNHVLGDEIYVPNLGAYKIISIDDNKSVALQSIPIRNTTFRNPMWQSNPYDSITSGVGIGLTITPTAVESIELVNDKLADIYILRATNCIHDVNVNINLYNPNSNMDLTIAIENINALTNDWDKIVSDEKYSNHINTWLLNQVENVTVSLGDSISALNDIITLRNDLNPDEFMNEYLSFINDCYDAYTAEFGVTPGYSEYDRYMRSSYEVLNDLIKTGNQYSNIDEMISIISDCVYSLDMMDNMILVAVPDFRAQFESTIKHIHYLSEVISYSRDTLEMQAENIEKVMRDISEMIANIPEDRQVDEWWRVVSISVAESGNGYAVGDIVKIIPKLPTDYNGNIIHDNEEVILNDCIYIQIKQVNEYGGVLSATPLIGNNATPYQLSGARETISVVGKGSGFIAYIGSIENLLENSTLFIEDQSEQTPNIFDENDLMKFTFDNAHNIGLTYEVFLHGIQITDFHVRHSVVDSIDVDIVYINANKVIELNKSSVYTKGEHYYTYKLQDLSINDGGNGYSVGQQVWVETNGSPLKLTVKEIEDTPYGTISSVDFAENRETYSNGNPSSENARAITDSMNNIDDEYSGTYYDDLPDRIDPVNPVGIIKPATFSYDPNEFTFTSHRFDDLTSGDRNARFMYPIIDKPEKLDDPNNTFYQGFELDSDHRWCRINSLTHIDDIEVPNNQPRNAEFQFIKRARIHNSSDEVIPMLKPLTAERINEIVDNAASENPQNIPYTDDFHVHEYTISHIDKITLESFFINPHEPGKPETPINVDDVIIMGANREDMQKIIDGEIIPESTPIFIDEHLIAFDVTDMYAITFINEAMRNVTIEVPNHKSIPTNISEWPNVRIGDICVVTNDETYEGHRMSYRVRSFSGRFGYFIYDKPEIADTKWLSFNVEWMNDNFYPDLPALKAMYPKAPWNTASKFRYIENLIDDGKIKQEVTPELGKSTFISELTIDDLSVYNHTTHQWEDLSSEKWSLEVNDNGFVLSYFEEGVFTYDMALYLNKKPSNQIRNAKLKRNASFKIDAVVNGEVNTQAVNSPVNTGRHLRIRKLYPFVQKETFICTADKMYMDFKINKYPFYRNELHLEDIQIFNKTTGEFEDCMDVNRFEIMFKDEKAVARGKETQTNIIQSNIIDAGRGFVDGEVWGYNEEYKTHVFGHITVDQDEGTILKFIPDHTVNAPITNSSIDFQIYQSNNDVVPAVAVIEFNTSTIDVNGDGYIHNVQNPLAPLPKEFRISVKYSVPCEYEITIDVSPKQWEFVLPEDKVFPVFYIPDQHIPQDHIYIIGNRGRYPLVNPSTEKPVIVVSYNDPDDPTNTRSTGTWVKFLNLYYAYEKIEIHYTPYPMRSIYTQRRIGNSGYVDLKGKLNKPLNKKYFEFWINGRLLHDEVTIVSPSKLFIHGSQSLRNFEIIEINRDANEFFSDNFLDINYTEYDAPYPVWNFATYLDDALEGTLEGDNYTLAEQTNLLSPVWPQVGVDHKEFKNYPPNMDTESDILLKVDEDFVAVSQVASSYQYMVVDTPTIEGVNINERNLTFDQFGFKPITDDMIINMLNEEWKAELEAGLLPTHSVISDDEWYGLLARLYDESGNLIDYNPMNPLDNVAYKIVDSNIVRINNKTKLVRLTKNPKIYDLE